MAASTVKPATQVHLTLVERLTEGLWLASVVLLPLVFDYGANQAFELPKLAVLLALGPAAASLAALGGGRAAIGRLRHPLALAGLAWLLTVGVATMTSIAPSRSLWGSYERQTGLIAAVGLVAIAAAPALVIRRPRQFARLAWALVLGSIPVVLYAMAQRAGLDPFSWLGRPLGVTSTFGSSTALGGYLAMIIPLTLALALRDGLPLGRPQWPLLASLRLALLTTLLAAQGSALLLTSVRGALVAAVIGAAVVAIAGLARQGARHRAWFWALAVAAILAVVGIAGIVTIMRGDGRVTSRLSPRNDDTVSQRIEIWQAAGQTLLSSGPRILTGFGPETQADAIESRVPRTLIQSLPAIRVDRAHLSPLDVLLTTGVLGGLAAAAIWAAALRSTWRALRVRGDLDLYAAGALGALTAHLLETAVAFPSIASLSLTSVLLGSIVALQSVTDKSPPILESAFTPGRRWSALAPVAAIIAAAIFSVPMLTRLQADRVYQRSLALWANEQPTEAIEMAQRAAQLAPDQDVYALVLGQQRLDHARSAPRDDGGRPAVLDADPGPAALLRASAEANREAVKLAPGDPFAWAALARSLDTASRAGALERSAALDEARLSATHAITLGPRRATFRDLAGRLALQAGAPIDALALFSGTIATDGLDAERIAEVGHAHHAMGNIEPALRSYQQALRLNDRSAPAWWGMSRLLLDRGELPEALDAAQRAARYEMNNWQYHRDLAHILIQMAMVEEARDELRTAARLAPSWEWPNLRAEIEALRS